MSEDKKFIEGPKRLSESKLWEIQSRYFNTSGVQVFEKDVPFYISSNAFIGEQYANLVLNMIKDWRNENPQSSEPFYILELGCGSGKFSFHLLKTLLSYLEDSDSDIQFRYILSDASQKNIDFCKNNKSLKPFVDKNLVDFSCYEVDGQGEITLELEGKPLDTLLGKTPLIVIANYVFDCIKQDAFELKDEKLYEVQFGLTSRYKNFNLETPKHLNELFFHYQNKEVSDKNYYQNPHLNKILSDYIEQYKEKSVHFMIPTGAFEFIDALNALTKNNYFLIIGDKGVSRADDIPLLSRDYRVTYDGCFAFILNFHAIEKYIEQSGGNACSTQNRNDFKVNLYHSQQALKAWPITSAYYKRSLDVLGPHEYCYIHDEFMKSSYRFDFKGILSLLRLSRWDPSAYQIIHDRLLELLPALTSIERLDLLESLKKVKNNLYQLAYGGDPANAMGVVYLRMDMLDEALDMFHQSIDLHPESSLGYHNAALVFEKQKNPPKALECFTKAYERNKKDVFARDKMFVLTGRSHRAALYPAFRAILVATLIGLSVYYITH